MVEATACALSARADGSGGSVSASTLARRLRLMPQSVREVGRRLLAAGLMRRTAGDDYRLACDPDRAGLRDVVAAVIGRPGDDGGAQVGRRNGPTLRELVARERSDGMVGVD